MNKTIENSDINMSYNNLGCIVNNNNSYKERWWKNKIFRTKLKWANRRKASIYKYARRREE